MKKMILVITLLSLPLAATFGFHPTTTSCNSCHIVHNAQTGTDVPLWNGAAPAGDQTYTKYYSETLDSTPGNPRGSTLLCLSCHDKNGSHSGMNTAAGDLSKSHPMEMVYNTALANADGELQNPAVATVIRTGEESGGTIANELLTTDGRVTCVSCHDVHIQGLHSDNVDMDDKPAGSGYGAYRIPHLQDIDGVEYKQSYRPADAELGYVYSDMSLKYGALCLTCHIK